MTAGSDAGIKIVFETFVNEKDKVIRPNPTFAMYAVYNKIFNCKEITLEYEKTNEGPKIFLKKIIKSIKKNKPKLFCLPNSDSPSGHAFKINEIEKILSAARQVNSFVLIDEAYYPFFPNTCIKLIKKYNNLIITRTTAKAWGLAGLRVGYVISSKANIKEMHKLRPMYEINNLGAEFLNKYLSNKKIVNSSVKRLLSGKKYFKRQLEKMGFKLFKKEEGNFIHVDFLDKRQKIVNNLKNIVYFRHNENHDSMKGFSRFSLTSKNNFIKIIKEIKRTIQND